MDVAMKDDSGRTPLHLATIYDAVRSAELLLQNSKAGLGGKDKDGYLPLTIALLYGSIEMVKLLVNAAASINVVDKQGGSALHHAANGDHEEIIQFLVEKGADVEARNQIMHTPLLTAASFDSDEAVKGEGNDTALHLAPRSQTALVAEFLIERGLDIEAVNNRGMTPLCVASEWGSEFVIDVLLRSGVNVEVKAERPWRALHFAATTGRLNIAETLL
ncbi:ankyrin repeat-containing domain protein [Hypoxylon sp. NC0597]|nr:ankyrin repeat-containing domain protein [Hypoxylon sp. NC0597]